MRRLTITLAFVFPLVASLAVRGAFAETIVPDGGAPDASVDASADARVRRDSGRISPIPPDPLPLEDKRQWTVELRWDKGEVYLVGVKPLELEAPRVTPRVMGRFALELYEGKTLIERVRFDFPGLIDGDFMDAGHRDPPRMDRKLTSRIGVLFPRTGRGTRLELWDRATDRRWPLGWPLSATPTP